MAQFGKQLSEKFFKKRKLREHFVPSFEPAEETHKSVQLKAI